MQPSYIRWTYHGEAYGEPGILDPLADADHHDEEEEDMELDLYALLQDLYPYATKKVHGFTKKNTFLFTDRRC